MLSFTCRCICDSKLCPEDPVCFAGMVKDQEKSNECCTVQKCLPTCVYNGKEYMVIVHFNTASISSIRSGLFFLPSVGHQIFFKNFLKILEKIRILERIHDYRD